MCHVPGPAQLAGHGVEALNHAGRLVALLAIEHLMAGDDHAAHDGRRRVDRHIARRRLANADRDVDLRSEEHTSELQSLMRISYAVFCWKKKKRTKNKKS